MSTVKLEITFVGLMLFVEDRHEGRLHVIVPSTDGTHGGHDGHPGGGAHGKHRATFLAQGVGGPVPLDGFRMDFSGIMPHELDPSVEATGAIRLGEFSTRPIESFPRIFLDRGVHTEISAHVVLDGGQLEGTMYDIFRPGRSSKTYVAPNILKWTRDVEVADDLHLPAMVPLTVGGKVQSGKVIAAATGASSGTVRTVSMLVCNIDASKPVPNSILDILNAPLEPFDPSHMDAFAQFFGGDVDFEGSGGVNSFALTMSAGVAVKCHPRVCATVWLPAE